MRRIQTKNMKTVHDDKERCINFDKKISSRSFFIICFSLMSKKKLMIVFWYTNHMNLKKILKKIFVELNIHENFVWIFSIKKRYCNRTDSVSRYNVSIRHSALEHMISFHFCITNQFSENDLRNYQMLCFKFNSWTWQWMFYLNSVIESDYQKCSWIWLHVQFLSHVIYKNWSHFFNRFSFLCNVLYSTKTS